MAILNGPSIPVIAGMTLPASWQFREHSPEFTVNVPCKNHEDKVVKREAKINVFITEFRALDHFVKTLTLGGYQVVGSPIPHIEDFSKSAPIQIKYYDSQDRKGTMVVDWETYLRLMEEINTSRM
jgi:hypothetical protein